MNKWTRALYQPCLPIGKDGKRVTGCAEHIQLSREAAAEGMVLLKNENSILPFTEGTRLSLFGKASVYYVKGVADVGQPYLIILPGSKNTIEDMKYLEESGLAAEIKSLHKKGVAIAGVCGGYQLLG